MKILEVYPKDVYATVEFSLQQLDMILEFLDNSIVEYNSEEKPKLHEAVRYVKNEFIPKSETLLEDYKK